MFDRSFAWRKRRVFGVSLAWSLVATSAFAGPPPGPVPEIDPGSASSVIAVLCGVLALMERKRS
jgi:hypothetical protein